MLFDPAAEPADFGDAMRAIAKARDRQAFAVVFAHFAPRVKAYLMRLGAEAGQAEDLMQDVMLTVWRRADTYDPSQAGAATWIFAIARNRRIDALRRERRPAVDPNDPTLVPDAPSPAEQVAAAVEWDRRLAAAIRVLPPEQAEMLRLAYYEDRSHSDIAGKLRLPLGTVKSRLRLALARLRSSLEDSQ
jgi:RNA polymerase sigma-70 factor (ECF subfamily)